MLLNIRTIGLSLKHVCASGLTCWRLKLRVENLVGVLYQNNKSCIMWCVLSHIFYSTPWILQNLWPPHFLFLKKRTLEEFESSALLCTYISKTIKATFQHYIDKNWGCLSLLSYTVFKGLYHCKGYLFEENFPRTFLSWHCIFGGWLVVFFCIFYSFLRFIIQI